jgi:hypothetical protein
LSILQIGEFDRSPRREIPDCGKNLHPLRFQKMATMTRLLSALCFCAFATLSVANDVQSAIFTPANPPTPIDVPNDHFLVIRNFTQVGGSDRGVITITIGSQPTDILSAAIIDPSTSTSPEIINRVVIAGPATVTVTCGTGATSCFISYRKDND